MRGQLLETFLILLKIFHFDVKFYQCPSPSPFANDIKNKNKPVLFYGSVSISMDSVITQLSWTSRTLRRREESDKDQDEVEEPRVASDDMERDEDDDEGRSRDRGRVHYHGGPIIYNITMFYGCRVYFRKKYCWCWCCVGHNTSYLLVTIPSG